LPFRPLAQKLVALRAARRQPVVVADATSTSVLCNLQVTLALFGCNVVFG
jgi:hypothetical protein